MKEIVLDWLGTFWKLPISPLPSTFLAEAKKADGKFASAVVWLLFYALYMYAMASLATGQLLAMPALLTVVLAVPLAVILFVSTIHFIFQQILGRKEYIYDKLLYITVAVLMPIFIVFAPMAGVISPDIFSILSFILLIYQVALLTIAVKAIAQIEYWQAFVIVVFSMFVGIIVGFLIYITILATIFPVMRFQS